MKPVAPIDSKSISALNMTASKNKGNNNKDESRKPPAVGTNDADKSPANSSHFSDGEMLSPGLKDVEPGIAVTIDKNIIVEHLKSYSPNECFDLLLRTLSEKERFEMFNSFATEFWKTNKHGVDNQASVEVDNDSTTQYQATMWNTGMFDGRETPMMSGFRPNYENFSRRVDPFSNDTFLDPSMGYTGPSSTAPFNKQHDPAGTAHHQGHSVPSGYTIPQGQPVTGTTAFSGPTGTSSSSPFVAPSHFGPPNPKISGQTLTSTQPMGKMKSPPPPINCTTANTANLNTSVQHPPPFSNQAPLSSQPPTQTTNQRFNAGPALSSGLLLRAAARPNAYASYDSDRVVVSRTQHGSTDKERAKIRELCTEAITPTITRGNITKLLGTSGTDYDISEDATRWQTSLANIWRHIIQ